MPLTVKRESKTVFTNQSATVVMLDGAFIVVKATRPDDQDDIKFGSLQEFKEFVRGCSEVLDAVNDELNFNNDLGDS